MPGLCFALCRSSGRQIIIDAHVWGATVERRPVRVIDRRSIPQNRKPCPLDVTDRPSIDMQPIERRSDFNRGIAIVMPHDHAAGTQRLAGDLAVVDYALVRVIPIDENRVTWIDFAKRRAVLLQKLETRIVQRMKPGDQRHLGLLASQRGLVTARGVDADVSYDRAHMFQYPARGTPVVASEFVHDARRDRGDEMDQRCQFKAPEVAAMEAAERAKRAKLGVADDRQRHDYGRISGPKTL